MTSAAIVIPPAELAPAQAGHRGSRAGPPARAQPPSIAPRSTPRSARHRQPRHAARGPTPAARARCDPPRPSSPRAARPFLIPSERVAQTLDHARVVLDLLPQPRDLLIAGLQLRPQPLQLVGLTVTASTHRSSKLRSRIRVSAGSESIGGTACFRCHEFGSSTAGPTGCWSVPRGVTSSVDDGLGVVGVGRLQPRAVRPRAGRPMTESTAAWRCRRASLRARTRAPRARNRLS
jgi:hypothetical protein